ncbi:hypothetical protein [Oribacterium sp. NK2B42]|uniref:hypothetical protein n=1 Tax=Oribacterium sp. NK2B42 TaxID=689781 RepID=UPI0012EB5330|nr:hypothetical protein [Oribacterium sp. NK2B42]
MSNRDEFTDKIKSVLYERVGGICSNPNCNHVTSGPHTDSEKRASIGVAAHITAASEGGPRYNKTLTSKERAATENGIWLCNSCATLIDKDAERYSVEKLKAWKKRAEERQLMRLEMAADFAEDRKLLETASRFIADVRQWVEIYFDQSELMDSYKEIWGSLHSLLAKYNYDKKYRYGGDFKSLREGLKGDFYKEESLTIIEDYINNSCQSGVYDNSEYRRFGTFLREAIDKADKDMRPYYYKIKESKERLVIGNKDYQYLRMISKNSEKLLNAVNSLYDKANSIDQSYMIYDEKGRAKYKDDIERIIADIEYYVGNNICDYDN